MYITTTTTAIKTNKQTNKQKEPPEIKKGFLEIKNIVTKNFLHIIEGLKNKIYSNVEQKRKNMKESLKS